MLSNHKSLVRRVVLRAKLAARSKVPTLWLENEAGERWVPDLANWNGAPPGFVYQWSRFPTLLRETCLRTVEQKDVDACPHTDTKPDLGIIDSMEGRECLRCHGYQSKQKGEPWPEKWEARGSREVMTGESSWPEELVLAMVRPNKSELAKSVERFGTEPRLLDMSDAIVIAATSCERCLNALLWRYGLDEGYPPYSKKWDETNTKCGLCETPAFWNWALNKPTHGHYIELCRECGTVISQCRCMNPTKETRYGICDACRGVPQEEPEPIIWQRVVAAAPSGWIETQTGEHRRSVWTSPDGKARIQDAGTKGQQRFQVFHRKGNTWLEDIGWPSLKSAIGYVQGEKSLRDHPLHKRG